MTYLGQLSPQPSKRGVASLCHRSFGSVLTPGATKVWWDDHFIYGDSMKAPVTSPITMRNVARPMKPGGVANVILSVYPQAINGYFWGFGTYNNSGLIAGSGVYKAPVSDPLAWVSAGGSLVDAPTSSAAYDFMYNDGTYMWLIDSSNIQRAALSNLASWTHIGASPFAGSSATYAVIGGTVYAYGGGTNQIKTASASTFTGWATSGNTLPTTLSYGSTWVDSTYVWIIGGNDNVASNTRVMRAPIGTPTVVTSLGNVLPNGGWLYATYYPYNGSLYAYTDSATYIAEDATALTSWLATNSLPTTTSDAMVYTDDDGFIYLAGGTNSSAALVTTIQYAIKDQPTLWKNHTAVLPTAMQGGDVIKTSQYYYMIGSNGTTGSYYRASLANPANWTLVSTNGPTRSFGRAFVQDGHVWYFSGESTALTTAVSAFSRATIVNGEIDDSSWIHVPAGASVNFMQSILPAIARFSLFAVGDYMYALGGYTNSTTVNTTVYRTRISRLIGSGGSATSQAGWLSVGTLTTAPVGASIAIANNSLYIMGGSTAMGLSLVDAEKFISCTLTKLAQGAVAADFIIQDDQLQMNGVSLSGAIGAKATAADGIIMLLGGKTTNVANGSSTIWLSHGERQVSLLQPYTPGRYDSIPTMDPGTGALGAISSFERTGMLPWLVTDK